ncbi:MAG: transposase, partial [Planctomycetaceae bacterium]|nr:transposase [Planctomycetaceae bacterium]
RRDIVRDDLDRSEFLRLLDRVASRHRWRVFAWALLDNHFHLFFRIQTPSLSAGMHDLESGYAALFNRRHERQGPLFQGRFHDVVVESESHAWELTRYVHLNPCRARLAPRPEAWPWSSYRHYLDPRGAPEWLDWPTVLAERNLREAAARIAYNRFVEAGLNEAAPNPIAPAVDGWILGSEAFVKRVQTVCMAGGSHDGPQTPDDVIEVVAHEFGTSTAVIRRRGRHGNSARDAAMMLCRELLATPASQLASVFGVSPSGLSMTVQRAGERLQSDDEFARQLLRIRKELGR